MTAAAQSESNAGNRYHALDAVRAFALLLGVVFHAAESFGSTAIYYWAVGDRSTSVFLEVCRHASHSFRLELFFLIAGFFAHLVWQRRGIRGFARNRAGRILVPLVVGWSILYPVLIWLWLTGAAHTGRWEAVGVTPEYRSTPPWQLTLGFFVSLGFLKKYDLTHLWFLYQLLVLYVAALGFRWVVLRAAGGKHVVSRLDEWFRRLMESRFRLGWLVMIVLLPLLFQREWGVDTPKSSLIPELPATSLFAVFFAVGWALHRQPDLLPVAAGSWRQYLGLGVVATLATLVMVSSLPGWVAQGRVNPVAARLAYFPVYGLMMWSFVLGFLGLFLHFRQTESPLWRYLADSSYWVYLIHLPIVVGLQIWVAAWPQPWFLKFPLVASLALTLSYLSYHFLVRSTFIGQQLNGHRYPLKRPRLPAGQGMTPQTP